MRASFVMLSTTRSDARAQQGISFYLSACRFPAYQLYICTSSLTDSLPLRFGFVIKAMIICSIQMGVLDFGPVLAD